ncbi:MAG: tetratricopeptide repeat protein [Thermoanaerobaculia bacterium]
MRTKWRIWSLAIVAVTGLTVAASLPAQAWRGGGGRLDGTVVDASGNPVADAVVQLRLNGQGPDLKTDKKGKWAVLGINGGAWSIDISAPGFQTFKTTVQVSEVLRVPTMKIQMIPAVKQEATEAVISVGGKKISPETAAAIEKGNVDMRAADELGKAYDACRTAPAAGKETPEAQEACAKAAEVSRSAKLKEAQQSFAAALKELPDNRPILTNLEIAYYLDGNLDEAVKYARQIVSQEPGDNPSWMMIAKLELERGHFDAGKEALSHIPEDKLTDPMPFLNMGILYYNKKHPAEAEEAFSKAIARRADMSEAYYYRGLARMQGKNNAGAKADFQKYMQLDPKGKDSDTVKDILKTIK